MNSRWLFLSKDSLEVAALAAAVVAAWAFTIGLVVVVARVVISFHVTL